MECPKCGWKNKDGAVACASCYYDLNSTGKKVVAMTPKEQPVKAKKVVSATNTAQSPDIDASPAACPVQAPVMNVNLDYAGFWPRAGAFIIDVILIGVVHKLIMGLLGPTLFTATGGTDAMNALNTMGKSMPKNMPPVPGAPAPVTPGSPSTPPMTPDLMQGIMQMLMFGLSMFLISLLIFFLIGLIYNVALNSTKGATLGKMLLKLKIVKADGSPIGVGKAILRYISEFIFGFITVCITFLVVAFTQKKQGLHDMVAGTVVVRV